MKRQLIYIAVVLIAIFSACEKQVEIKTSFPFTVEADFREEIVINVPSETSFTLTPERIVTTNVYTMSYRVLSGRGSFYIDDSTILEENQVIELDGLSIDLLFKPSEIGDIEIEATFSDQQGEQQSQIINYVSIDNPFTVELNTISTTATINESKDFTLILSNTGDDLNVTYTASLFLSQGTGTIDLLNEEGEVVERVNQNERFEISPGTYNYSVTLSEDGVNILKVNIEDSNSQKASDEIEFAVNVINYTLTGEPTANTTTIGNDIEINFNLNEVDGGNADYAMRYILTEGDADIFSGATQVSAGSNIDITLGAFTWIFRPTQIGEVDLKFVAINSTGVEKEVDIKIVVQDRNFDFTSTRSLANLPLGQSVAINYVITENGGDQEDNYTMIFSTSNNGTLSINGQEYSAGTVIALPSLNFEAIYTGTSAGKHEIESVITAVSNSLSVSKTVEVEYLSSEFTFNVTSDTELTVGDTIPVEFTLNETVGQSTFDISYSVTGTNQEFRNENNIVLSPSTQYDVESNTFSWSLTAIEQGTMNVTYTAINQFGVIESQTIEYTILPIQFDFTVAPNGTQFLTSNDIRFDFDMAAPNTITYQLSFESNGSAIVRYNGTTFNEGQKFNVTNNDFSLLYITQTAGSNIINWTIEASNGVVQNKSTNINVDQIPVITSFDFFRIFGGCTTTTFNYKYFLTFTKNPSATITNINFKFYLNNNNNLITEENVPVSISNTDEQIGFEEICITSTFNIGVGGARVEAVITDSNGKQSAIFIDDNITTSN